MSCFVHCRLSGATGGSTDVHKTVPEQQRRRLTRGHLTLFLIQCIHSFIVSYPGLQKHQMHNLNSYCVNCLFELVLVFVTIFFINYFTCMIMHVLKWMFAETVINNTVMQRISQKLILQYWVYNACVFSLTCEVSNDFRKLTFLLPSTNKCIV